MLQIKDKPMDDGNLCFDLKKTGFSRETSGGGIFARSEVDKWSTDHQRWCCYLKGFGCKPIIVDKTEYRTITKIKERLLLHHMGWVGGTYVVFFGGGWVVS